VGVNPTHPTQPNEKNTMAKKKQTPVDIVQSLFRSYKRRLRKLHTKEENEKLDKAIKEAKAAVNKSYRDIKKKCRDKAYQQAAAAFLKTIDTNKLTEII